jgi:hypothetical protein
MYDSRRPENAELMMIKLLSYFIVTRQTPHIVLPIGTFDADIKTFVNLVDDEIVDKDNKKYKEFIKAYKNNQYYGNVSILISEWANRGDLLEFIRKWYENFIPLTWKVIFFQIISTLAVIQSKFPSFRHNDLKANNILIHKISKDKVTLKYIVVSCEYKVPNIGYYIKLWDFDFACIPGIVDNIKVATEWTEKINVTPEQNRYYDLHYFFNTLIKDGFFPKFMTDPSIPQDAQEFVNRIVPPIYQKQKKNVVHERGRILVNTEYTTPEEVLRTDPYFEEFRVTAPTYSTSMSDKKSSKQKTMPDMKKFLSQNEPIKTQSKTLAKPKILKKTSIGKTKKEKSRTISDDILKPRSEPDSTDT